MLQVEQSTNQHHVFREREGSDFRRMRICPGKPFRSSVRLSVDDLDKLQGHGMFSTLLCMFDYR
jgi:hypothetical protein